MTDYQVAAVLRDIARELKRMNDRNERLDRERRENADR